MVDVHKSRKKNPAENSIADCLFPRSQSLQRLLIVIKCQNIYNYMTSQDISKNQIKRQSGNWNRPQPISNEHIKVSFMDKTNAVGCL